MTAKRRVRARFLIRVAHTEGFHKGERAAFGEKPGAAAFKILRIDHGCALLLRKWRWYDSAIAAVKKKFSAMLMSLLKDWRKK